MPQNSAATAQQLHDGTSARVQDNGVNVDILNATDGVKQSYNSVPPPPPIMTLCRHVDQRIPRYRDVFHNCFDGESLNLRRLQARTIAQADVIREPFCVDDRALYASPETKCNAPLTSSQTPAATMVSPLLPVIMNHYIRQPQETSKPNHSLPPMVRS